MESSIVSLIYPEITTEVADCVIERFPHLQQHYLALMLEREVSELVISLLAFEIVDFRDEWVKYNRQVVQCFVRNYCVFNMTMNHTPAEEVDPFVIMNISA